MGTICYLFQGCYVFVLVDPEFISDLAELGLVGSLRQYLTADKGADVLAVYDDRSRKVHQTVRAVVYGRLTGAACLLTALEVAAVALLCAYARLTGKLHAEICEVAAFGDRTVFVGRREQPFL